jgi:hypothetical protein
MDIKKDSKEYQLEYALGYLVGSIDRILFSKLKDSEKLDSIRGVIEDQKKVMGIKK